MKFFSINVRQFGKWQAFREAVPMDKEDPRGHIVHALTELWMYSFEYIDGVTVVIANYERQEDGEGNIVMEADDEDGTLHEKQERTSKEYEWEGESFKQFIETFLSSKTEI